MGVWTKALVLARESMPPAKSMKIPSKKKKEEQSWPDDGQLEVKKKRRDECDGPATPFNMYGRLYPRGPVMRPSGKAARYRFTVLPSVGFVLLAYPFSSRSMATTSLRSEHGGAGLPPMPAGIVSDS